MKKVLLSLFILLCFNQALVAQDIVGFWKTISDKTGKPESILAMYEYHGKYFGRLIATYDDKGDVSDSIENPKFKAPGVVGHPYYSGLDIIWDLEKKGNKYINGTILDPQAGSEYDAEAWIKDGKLVVRGEILFLGRNEVWPPATHADFPQGFKMPDLTKIVPNIPMIK